MVSAPLIVQLVWLFLLAEPGRSVPSVSPPPNAELMGPVWDGLAAVWPDPNQKKITLVCHGHSVPAGYFDVPRVDTLGAYPHQLQHLLKEHYPFADVHVVVSAVSGENALRGAKRFDRDALAHRPDVVILDYSLNDRLFPLGEVRAAWVSMIKAAQRQGARVILMTPSADLESNPFDETDLLQQHARQVRALAAEFGTGLVDSDAIFKQRLQRFGHLDDWMSTSNHPNRAGHAAIAAALFTWFVPPPPQPAPAGPPRILHEGSVWAWRGPTGTRHVSLRLPRRKPQAMLIFGHRGRDGDSRDRLDVPTVQAFAERHGWVLVGLQGFDGPDLLQKGAAPLWRALSELAEAADQPGLASLPFFAFGHENGGQTAFALAADRPDLCLGFGSNNATWFLGKTPPPALLQVPGGFVLGAYDPTLTRKAIADMQALTESVPAWSLLIEPDKGRETGASEAFWFAMADQIATQGAFGTEPRALLNEALTRDADAPPLTLWRDGPDTKIEAGSPLTSFVDARGERFEWIQITGQGVQRQETENNTVKFTPTQGLNLFIAKVFSKNKTTTSRPTSLFVGDKNEPAADLPQPFNNLHPQHPRPAHLAAKPVSHMGLSTLPGADLNDRNLVAYRLTPEQEQGQEWQGKVVNSWWAGFDDGWDQLVLNSRDHAARDAIFSQTTTRDAGLSVRAAYGAHGLYFHIRVTDQEPYGAPPNFDNFVFLTLDPFSAKQIQAAHPGDVFLKPARHTLTQTFSRFDIVFAMGEPEITVWRPRLWRVTQTEPTQAQLDSPGLKTRVLANQPHVWTIELKLPWAVAGLDPEGKRRMGRMLGFSIGFHDDDPRQPGRKLVWPGAVAPARKTENGAEPDVWGDLVLGPRTPPAPVPAPSATQKDPAPAN
ncbi:SGNH-hydro domain-containing protein [Acanthopleuribacter pedis]